ncbi:amidohydrolase family protein [Nocardia sp. NPDC047038]|uniref:amidohydrolase family protein n=1 Tax=Nocardia sp. NPDC047038 TaxID=3154338 RepID=UPI00340FD5AF
MSRTLLRGAQVITMALDRPDVEEVDILVDGDRITEIGDRIDPRGADVVEFAGRIIIPGLVNAHLHSWQTAMRFAGADWSLPEYLVHAHGVAARHYRPQDIHIGTFAGALNQIDSGVTTIGDWSHNCVTPDHADAAIDALKQAGIRAVLLHGTPHGLRDRVHDTREIDRLLGGAIATSELLSLGMAVAGPQLSKPEVAVADLRAAADRGLLASMHQSAGPPGPGWQAVSAAGLWGPLTNIVHGTGLTTAWVKRLVEAGVSFTTTPENELGQGHCARVADQLLSLGAAPSLGTDTEIVAPGEMLVAARLVLARQRGLAHEQAHAKTGLGAPVVSLGVKQALAWATVEGARALGMADRIGRIEVGMQADLVVIDARALNLWPLHDPIAAALHANVGNIEAVMIAGCWRKRHHQLVDCPVDEILQALQRSGERFVDQINATGRVARIRRRVVGHVVRRQLRQQARGWAHDALTSHETPSQDR